MIPQSGLSEYVCRGPIKDAALLGMRPSGPRFGLSRTGSGASQPGGLVESTLTGKDNALEKQYVFERVRLDTVVWF